MVLTIGHLDRFGKLSVHPARHNLLIPGKRPDATRPSFLLPLKKNLKRLWLEEQLW